MQARNALRRAARSFSSAGTNGSAAKKVAPVAVPPTAAVKTPVPAAAGGAGKPPAVKVEVEAPGMADTKKAGSGAGKLVTLLALLGGAGGAYYAYDQGLLPKSVVDSIPKELLAMLPPPSVSASSSQTAPAAKAAAAPAPAAVKVDKPAPAPIAKAAAS